jgi:hypothetical protein
VDSPTRWIIIWLPNHEYLLGNQISPKSEDFFILAAIANQRWISIRNIIIYLETKFRPNQKRSKHKT